MGSQSDWPIMKNAKILLDDFNISCEVKIISAHRTPTRIFEYAKKADLKGIKVIIAGAGGAAHLPGMISSHSNLPVIGVPINNTSLNGLDSLLSIVQMPKGIPVATMSIGEAGARNSAIFAIEILSINNKSLRKKLLNFKQQMSREVPTTPKQV